MMRLVIISPQSIRRGVVSEVPYSSDRPLSTCSSICALCGNDSGAFERMSMSSINRRRGLRRSMYLRIEMIPETVMTMTLPIFATMSQSISCYPLQHRYGSLGLRPVIHAFGQDGASHICTFAATHRRYSPGASIEQYMEARTPGQCEKTCGSPFDRLRVT
jgi:hypothetical protein